VPILKVQIDKEVERRFRELAIEGLGLVRALSVKAEYIVSYDKHFDGLEFPRENPGRID
jgi:predicted nucleic acid-binding protein